MLADEVEEVVGVEIEREVAGGHFPVGVVDVGYKMLVGQGVVEDYRGKKNYGGKEDVRVQTRC